MICNNLAVVVQLFKNNHIGTGVLCCVDGNRNNNTSGFLVGRELNTVLCSLDFLSGFAVYCIAGHSVTLSGKETFVFYGIVNGLHSGVINQIGFGILTDCFRADLWNDDGLFLILQVGVYGEFVSVFLHVLKSNELLSEGVSGDFEGERKLNRTALVFIGESVFDGLCGKSS